MKSGRESGKIAVIQLDSKPGEISFNLRNAGELIGEAVHRGASLLVLPELFAFGYDLSLAGKVPYGDEDTVAFLSEQSRKYNIILAGGYPETTADGVFDTLAVFDNGNPAASYRKMHIFPLSGETGVFIPGNHPVILEWGEIRLGLAICFDLRFSELFRYYRKENCHGVIVSAAFPLQRAEHWHTLLKSRAIENQFYIMASNRCGQDGDLRFCGGSSLLDPEGKIIVSNDERAEGISCSDIGLDVVSDLRNRFPCRENDFFY